MSEVTFTVDTMGNWEYGDMIPVGLYGEIGQPLSWHLEQTGAAKAAKGMATADDVDEFVRKCLDISMDPF